MRVELSLRIIFRSNGLFRGERGCEGTVVYKAELAYANVHYSLQASTKSTSNLPKQLSTFNPVNAIRHLWRDLDNRGLHTIQMADYCALQMRELCLFSKHKYCAAPPCQFLPDLVRL